MSFDFSRIAELSTARGKLVELKNSAGRVIWAVKSNVPIILEVEKITSDTYAAETTYTSEEFILLDIYPKTNGTVRVTYGGLTKTITDTSGAAEPNAQQVFFGTFNGVSDEVETPASGTLTIEGRCESFGCSTFQPGSKSSNKGYSKCITAVNEWSGITKIVDYAFYGCANLALTELPNSITSIGDYAFNQCSEISIGEIPEGVTEIGANAFWVGDTNSMPDTIILPSTLTYIGDRAFCSHSTTQTAHSVVSNIIIHAIAPPTLGGGEAFGTYNQGETGDQYFGPNKIVVPAGCGKAYKTAEYWSKYADYITEAS